MNWRQKPNNNDIDVISCGNEWNESGNSDNVKNTYRGLKCAGARFCLKLS